LPGKTPSSSSLKPTTDRAAVVAEARAWVSTPFRHQGRLKGVAVDCVGLIIGVGLELDILPDFSAAAFRPFASYARTPNPRQMGEAMRKFLRPSAIGRGDLPPDGTIGWLEWREDLPMHLVIKATHPSQARPTLIHAAMNRDCCVEHGFVAEWPDRIASWWDYPPLALG
jgi:hypothetical protein